ncbi:sulfotransferase family protein [Crenothrix polyspora]|uniref:Sulfotransferase n=1 Tax=Crenothrix polyspora TaxID=360316 RepID=A0A1R4GZG7_9GAMM|nr:sulfotransferase [Crenothrix polyspora]SJM88979.1 hypothetical protein CRENPOLYSF1_10012 [Crenothrix polyspora]
MNQYNNDNNYRELIFGIGNYGSLCLYEGWSSPETWGVKNSSNCCSIRLPHIDTTRDNITLNISCKCLSDIDVSFNGIPVASWIEDRVIDEHFVRSFTIDSHAIYNDRLLTFKTKNHGDFELISLWLDKAYFRSKLIDYSDEIKNIFGFQINNDFRQIFVTGVPRSGTTIVYKILNSIFTSKIQSLLESFFLVYLFDNQKNKFHEESALSFLGGNSDQVHAFNYILNCLEGDFNKDSIRELVEKYYSFVVNYYDCNILIDKTPDHIFYWRVIFDVFDNSKIVFCKRDPLEIFASIKKRLIGLTDEQVKQTENKWLLMSSRDFIPYYEEYLTAYKQCVNENSERIFFLDYEKFVSRDPILLNDFAIFLECDLFKLIKALDEPFLGNENQGQILGDHLINNKINPTDWVSKEDFYILNSYFN